MVGEREPPGAGGVAHRGRILDGAVAPARLGGVLGGRVLRVVDDEVGARQELGVVPVAPVDPPVAAPEFVDAARLAAETGLPLPKVYSDARNAYTETKPPATKS